MTLFLKRVFTKKSFIFMIYLYNLFWEEKMEENKAEKKAKKILKWY